MSKNKGRRRRRKNSKTEDRDDANVANDDDNNAAHKEHRHLHSPHLFSTDYDAISSKKKDRSSKSSCNKNNDKIGNHKSKNSSFAKQRELQRKASADKQRHTSSYHLTDNKCGISGVGNHKKVHSSKNSVIFGNALAFPSGFEKSCQVATTSSKQLLSISDGLPSSSNRIGDRQSSSFRFVDAGMGDGKTVLDYLCFGRHGNKYCNGQHRNQHYPHHRNNEQEKRILEDSIGEYQSTMARVLETTNFGGCIARCYLSPSDLIRPIGSNDESSVTSNTDKQWTPYNSFPFQTFGCENNIEYYGNNGSPLVYFVVGFGPDFDSDIAATLIKRESENAEQQPQHSLVNRLAQIVQEHDNDVVGLFADLDYSNACRKQDGPPDSFHSCCDSYSNSNDHESCRQLQLQRLRYTLKAAAKLDCPVQIRILPGFNKDRCDGGNANSKHSSNNRSRTDGVEAETGEALDAYLQAIRDLATVLLEHSCYCSSSENDMNQSCNATSIPPYSFRPWKVHISCWNGKAEHMMALLKAFPATMTIPISSTSRINKSNQNSNLLYFGFDGHVTFSKATHLHECAFEVPLDRLLLETGGPSAIPSAVAKHVGRGAFCHPGHIPFVAEAVAKQATKNPRTCQNAYQYLYGKSGNIVLSTGEGDPPMTEVTAQVVAQYASKNISELYGIAP